MEEKDINWFKYKLNTCTEDIGNEVHIQKVFEELKEKYIKDYDPPKKDQELKSEFDNQKDNMEKNAKDLSDQLKLMKKKHVVEIEKCRQENSNLISKIDNLKKNIKAKKSHKSKEAADYKHISSIAAIEAQKNLKFLEDIEYNSLEEKIEILEKELEKRKAILKKKEERNFFESQSESEGKV